MTVVTNKLFFFFTKKKFQQKHFFCLGDFNARIALKPDYFVNDNNTDIPVMSRMFTPDTIAAYPRGNMDTGTNSYGDRLLELCQSVPLRICNGRKFGDVTGSYTCYKHNGQSTVDFCAVSPRIYHLVVSFFVNELLPVLSDHCSCTVTLKTSFVPEYVPSNTYNYLTKPKKVPWNGNLSELFENEIQNAQSKAFLSVFNNQCVDSQFSLDTAVASLSNFLVSAAQTIAGPVLDSNKCGVSKKSQSPNWKFRKRPPRFNKPKWFDCTCESLQRQIKITSRLLKQQPRNSFIKGRLMQESKKLKSLQKHKKKQYVEAMFTELDGLHNSNPKAYMDLVRSLRDGSFDKKVSDSTSHVSPELWREHFQGLLGPVIKQSPAEDEMIAFVKKKCDTVKSSLDLPFSRQELLSTISSLKNNKAISFDQVSAEMLKTSKLVITKQFLFLFNIILSSTMYPTEWKQNILTPIHKSGELTDHTNFRGIAVSSCLGKLFNKMLQRRLENKCVNEGIINNNQGSGKKSSRTSDHLLVIRFLVDKYVVLGGKKLYACCCFFYIRRAFDCLPRNHLFYTLLRDNNVGGNFLKILQEIYSENQIYIKLTNGLCEPFKTTNGVLQGEANSSLLFNIFVNKISEIFDQSCEPVHINKTDHSCLLWSDD